MADKNIWKEQNLTCKPLDSLEEISAFLQDPPSWRTLCMELKPHSKKAVRNCEINNVLKENILQIPQTFCHYDPEVEEVARHDREALPQTLVCHDMANGYHDDSVIDGTGNHGAYTFFNWAVVDIFCYFSHHFITIPPLGWINVGHAHGVKVIGTVIAEWRDGELLWDKILESESEWRQFASALVAIAKTLRFDGWLLNIENKVNKPSALIQFVGHLHAVLHQELESPLLVWYDSVTVNGDLQWQNGLNDKNKVFYEASDGLFTNYSWSIPTVRESVKAATSRRRLLLGMDVWGRNFYGGGKFNTSQAVQVAFDYECSMAIFAPAWTHEALPAADDPSDPNTVVNAEQLEPHERFLLRERALWGSLWPWLVTKLPNQLPFHSSFCRGHGKTRRWYGEVICPVPWYNINHMQYQSNSSHGPHGYFLCTADTMTYLQHRGLFNDKDGILKYRQYLGNQVTNIQIESNERSTVKRKINDTFINLFDLLKVAKTGEKSNEAPETSVKEKVRYMLAYVPHELECLEQFFEDSFLGGSCLKVNPSDEIDTQHRLSRIFFCDFELRSTLIACVVTKTLSEYEDQALNIILNITDSQSDIKKVVLLGSGSCVEVTVGTMAVCPMHDASDPGFKELQTYLVLQEPDFYIPVANAFGWKVRYYEVGVQGRVTSVSCRTNSAVGPILLGYFGICARNPID